MAAGPGPVAWRWRRLSGTGAAHGEDAEGERELRGAARAAGPAAGPGAADGRWGRRDGSVCVCVGKRRTASASCEFIIPNNYMLYSLCIATIHNYTVYR